jgi:hypothetical protein
LDAIQHDGLFVGRRRRLSKEGGIVRVGNPFLATAMAVASIQEFTDVYRSLRTYTGVYGRIQEFTDRSELFTDRSEYTGVYGQRPLGLLR